MAPDIFVCWPEGGPPALSTPPSRASGLHPRAPRGQRLENNVNTSVFSSSSPQQWPKTMQFTAFFVAGKKHRKNRWFLMRIGLKNDRKMTKNQERFCRKGFLRLLEASKLHKTMVFTGFCAPSRQKTPVFTRFSALFQHTTVVRLWIDGYKTP